MTRPNNRAENALRPVDIIPHYTEMAPGSVLIECGRTRVICTASVEESVPPFLKGTGKGWLTAEYAMLPGSTDRRKQREYGKRDGRSVEIQRLIGRSLRACCDLTRMGERTIYLDCDVIQADGGTRTASITGAFVALCLAVEKLIARGDLVDNLALRQALIDGTIAGAGLDTVAPEPVPPDHPLLTMPTPACDRLVLAPHLGGITEASFQRAHLHMWRNAERVADGHKPDNIVNGLE